MNSPRTGEPMDHGLCLKCRREELAGEREWQRLEEIKKTPINLEAEHYWNEMTEILFTFLMGCNGVICGKVGEEVLNKICIVQKGINRLLDNMEIVIEKSTLRTPRHKV
jgi:hypothetical protein